MSACSEKPRARPFNATTRLPSFDWANAWGLPPLGDVFVPVLTAEVATQAGSLFVSGRFKSVLNNLINLNEVRPDLFVGVELPLASGLQLELRAAAW